MRAPSLTQLSIAYVLAPNLPFVVYWFRPEVAAVGFAAIAVAAWALGRYREPAELARCPMGVREAVVVASVAAVWIGLSGIGGAGLQNSDYGKHNAVFRELATRPWPVVTEDARVMVYAIGYYLPAGGVAKLAGWNAGQWFSMAWAWAGLCAALAWFARIAGGRAVLGVPLFVVLGGLDVLGVYWNEGSLPAWGTHIEWWAGPVQYSSNSTLLFWVPQHALPGWILAGTIYANRNAAGFVGLLGAALAAALLWSPFAFVGLAAVAVPVVAARSVRECVTPANVFAAPVLAGLAAAYFSANAFQVPSGWAWHEFETSRALAGFAAFALLEFGLYAALLWAMSGFRAPGPQSIYVIALLCALPLVRVGLYNDFTMRASIAPLFLLWVAVARGLERGIERREPAAWALAAAVAIGAFTGASEIHRSIVHYEFGVPELRAISPITRVYANEQYMGDTGSLYWRSLSRRDRHDGP